MATIKIGGRPSTEVAGGPKIEDIKSTNGALNVYLSSLLSGENQSLGYLSIADAATEYETVAASQTDQVLGNTGAAGDYLGKLIIVVTTAATAQVQIKDGSGSAITVFPNSPGSGIGTYVLSVGLLSTSGAWKVTTGAGSSVIACGLFS